MRHYPIFLDLNDQPVLVVGAGVVAARKAAMLAAAGARVGIVAAQLTDELADAIAAGRFWRVGKQYRAEQLQQTRLVIAATDDRALNARVAADAEKHGVLVNVVDQPALCRFIVPSIVDRSPILIAISSGGAAPLLARLLRERLEQWLAPSWGSLAELAERWRERIRARLPDVRRRRDFLQGLMRGRVARLLQDGREAEAEQSLDQQLRAVDPQPQGHVALVGAGAGSADLLTLAALRELQDADVVLYDRLVSPDILELIRRDARRIDVGKRVGSPLHGQDRINQRLIAEAKAGHRVVRLKGGDPLVFGRGGEEIDALRDAGIAFSIVPGISAAQACAAHAGIPLTHRGRARAVHLFTAQADAGNGACYQAPAALTDHQATLVAYMGASRLCELQQSLLAAGRDPATPVALVENGGRPQQRVIVTDLTQLPAAASEHALQAPALSIIGEVAASALDNHWYGSAPIDARGTAAVARCPTSSVECPLHAHAA